MTPYEIIIHKRNGKELSAEEIRYFISGYVNGEIEDYQMSALLMAVYFQGMQKEEIFHLTRNYIDSGITIELSDIPGTKVDKHSTGGVGDKISIILAPLAACLGVVVPMISGRGLGHSGGTLDKLESIPGFNTQLSIAEFKKILSKTGVAMMGQTGEIVPADKKIYALRDVTGTVESIPLIVASIMSKKIAEGIDALILDVKYGSGAFMKDPAQAELLAKNLIEIGQAFDKKVIACLTSMEQPLGYRIGNWLEIEESLECLQGRGPDDVLAVTVELTAHMLLAAKQAESLSEARTRCREALKDGRAFKKFLELASAQGAELKFLESPHLYPQAKYRETLAAGDTGFLQIADTREIGMASVELGAGRVRSNEPVDPQSGIILFKKTGEEIKQGEIILEIHTNRKDSITPALTKLRQAMNIVPEKTESPALILKKINEVS